MSKHAISFAGIDKLTRDSFKDECDINNIVATFVRTGMVNHIPRTEPQYGEAPDLSFHEAACIAARAASLTEEGWTPTPTEIVDSEASQAVSDDSGPEGAAPQDAAPGNSEAAK